VVARKAELQLLLVRAHSGHPEGWRERMIVAARRAIPEFEQANDHAGLATAWRRLAWAHGTACRYGPAADAAEHAMEHARRADDPRQGRRAASQYAIAALHGPTPVREAIRRCSKIAEDVRGDHRTEGLVLSLLAVLHAMSGNFDEARQLLAQARSTLEELGQSVVAASMSLSSFAIELLAGDLAAAERELRRDHEALARLGERYLLSTVAGELARILHAEGRYEEAAEVTREAEELAASDDIASQTLWRSVRAKTLARQGLTEDGLRLAWEAVELIDRTDANVMKAETFVDLAEVLRLADRPQEAETWFERAFTLLVEKENVVAADNVRMLAAAAA
jgi:ATP/maltotriose-dependent transcriptional regulator MalT